MKKISLILFLSIILLVCAGCAAEAPTETEASTEKNQTVITDDTSEDKVLEYEFFYTESLAGDLSETLSVKSAYDNGFGGSLKTVIGMDNAVAKKVSPIDGKEHTYVSSQVRYKNTETKEAYGYYSRYDQYTTQDSLVAFLHGTDILTKYTNEAVRHDHKGERNLEEEQIKATADDFLKKIYTQKELSEYIYSYSNTGYFAYDVLYTKYIHGYMTEEYINVLFNISGEIIGYDAPNAKKFSEPTEALSKESLDMAYQKLTEKIASMGLDITYQSGGCIVKNNEGKLFMEISIQYKKDGQTFATSIMINLE